MNLTLPKPRSLETRVLLVTLAVFLLDIWSLAFYASRLLQTGDMQTHIILVSGLLTMLTCGLIWWMLKRQFAPLKAAMKTVAAIPADSSSLQPLPNSGHDEISELVSGFNRLLNSMAQQKEAQQNQILLLQSGLAQQQESHKTLQLEKAQLEKEIEEHQATQQSLAEQLQALKEHTSKRESEITAHAAILESRTRIEEQLQQSRKIEALGLLAGRVAHDFNNIIAAIMGYGEILLRLLPDGKACDNATQILKATERATELTGGLLAFSSKQLLNLERLDINQLGADYSNLLQQVLGEEIELVMVYHPIPLYLMLDRSQIKQVLMNLAANARSAMPGGGKLTISISSTILDNDFITRQGYGNPGYHALIRVSDTGSGLDKETVLRIFEPFYTITATGKSFGLDLSKVHGIIAQHLGFIHCSSDHDVGTTFAIYLPLSDAPVDTSVPLSETEAHSPRGNETILLAEDDDMLMEITTLHLESSGYRVLQAYNGVDAVEIFKNNPDKIDLVMLDAVMPKMTGKQAWNEISALRPGVKACFLSAYTNEIISGKLAVDFSIPFISKPVLSKTLLRKVRDILDGKTF